MSKLTNEQIRAQIHGLSAAIAGAASRGDVSATLRRQKKLDAYRAELADRESAGLNPGTEIQADRRRSL